MTPEQFSAFAAQGFNRIPVTRQVLADLDTPLTTYLKLANAPYSSLFVSVQGGEKWGRYSIISLPAQQILTISGQKALINRHGELIESIQVSDTLDFVTVIQARFSVTELDSLTRFNGVLFG